MTATLHDRYAERSALAAEVLRGGGQLRLRVHGESMLPTLGPRDVVHVASCTFDDLRPGEIVLAQREGRLFLHRFVARHADAFLLQGDSMPAPDPLFATSSLLGRLTTPAHPLRHWRWMVGRLVCHCDLARRLLLRLHNLRARLHRIEADEYAVSDGTI